MKAAMSTKEEEEEEEGEEEGEEKEEEEEEEEKQGEKKQSKKTKKKEEEEEDEDAELIELSGDALAALLQSDLTPEEQAKLAGLKGAAAADAANVERAASAFIKQKQEQKKAAAELRRQAIAFKLRVLDLLEIWVKRQRHSVLLFGLIQPTLAAIGQSASKEKEQLRTRLTSFFRNKLCKPKAPPRVAVRVTEETAATALPMEKARELAQQLLERAKKADGRDLLAAINAGLLFVLRLTLGGAFTVTSGQEDRGLLSYDEWRQQLDWVVGLYTAALQHHLGKKHSRLNLVFFKDFFTQAPAIAVRLIPTLASLTSSAASAYLRIEADKLLTELLKTKQAADAVPELLGPEVAKLSANLTQQIKEIQEAYTAAKDNQEEKEEEEEEEGNEGDEEGDKKKKGKKGKGKQQQKQQQKKNRRKALATRLQAVFALIRTALKHLSKDKKLAAQFCTAEMLNAFEELPLGELYQPAELKEILKLSGWGESATAELTAKWKEYEEAKKAARAQSKAERRERELAAIEEARKRGRAANKKGKAKAKAKAKAKSKGKSGKGSSEEASKKGKKRSAEEAGLAEANGEEQKQQKKKARKEQQQQQQGGQQGKSQKGKGQKRKAEAASEKGAGPAPAQPKQKKAKKSAKKKGKADE